MLWSEAKAELKEIAKGAYHSLSFELTEVSPKKLETKCGVYIDRYSCHYAPTFREALDKMRTELGESKIEEAQEIDDEMPEAEAGDGNRTLPRH